MRISEKGLSIIKKYEGLRLTAYKCPAGVWTIGWGHTSGVREGMTITKTQAEQFLLEDMESSERAVMKYDDIYGWNQNQFDALVSFTFNCGAGNLKTLLQDGKRTIVEISAKIPAYNKAAGKTLSGLVKRRTEEKELFDSWSVGYFKKYTGKSGSLVDALNAIGVNSFFKYRKQIAAVNGIDNYKGTANQNTTLLILLKKGMLIKP